MGVRQPEIFCARAVPIFLPVIYGTKKVHPLRCNFQPIDVESAARHNTKYAFVYRAFLRFQYAITAHVAQLQPRHLADATPKEKLCSCALS